MSSPSDRSAFKTGPAWVSTCGASSAHAAHALPVIPYWSQFAEAGEPVNGVRDLHGFLPGRWGAGNLFVQINCRLRVRGVGVAE
jgi:hypothetical protein